MASPKLISVRLRSTGHSNDVSKMSVPMRTKQNMAKRRWSPLFLKWSESRHINGIRISLSETFAVVFCLPADDDDDSLPVVVSLRSRFRRCSSAMYAVIRSFEVSRFLAASRIWVFWADVRLPVYPIAFGLLHAAKSFAEPSRILISKSIFCSRSNSYIVRIEWRERDKC